MKLEDIRQNIGAMVMTCDPGRKLGKSLSPHGPYRIKQLTKGGLVILEGYEDYRVAPSQIWLYIAPLGYTPNLKRVVTAAETIARSKGEEYLSAKHLLLAMIKEQNPTQDLFIQGGVTYEHVEALLYPKETVTTQ